MRIAIFHNYLDNIGGAEIVTLLTARELNADIYTTNIDKDKIEKMGFKTDNIYSIGRIPINAPFKQQLAQYRFSRLKLDYDFYIIAGDWAMAGAKNNKPNLWYVHSPTRELHDLYEELRSSFTFPKNLIFAIWVKYNRWLQGRNIKHVNNFVSNSNNTKNRLLKYLDKESTVIHPPVETKLYKNSKGGDYWLSVNRLYTHKRIEMQLEAFRKMPDEKLIIVGSYEQSKHFLEYVEKMEKLKPDNVEIISWVSDKELKELYANCKGFIATSMDEDFGMNVVEAMASGKFVIAPNEGGYKESIIDGITGKLIDNINSNKITDIIKSKLLHNPKECIKRAKLFDLKIFIKKLNKIIILRL